MCVKTSLICRTKWFCNKEFLSWLSAELFSWSHDKSRISLGTVSSTHLLGMSQTEPLYFSLCPAVCHIYIYWPCCYLMPSVSDWKRCLYFLILLLCIPKSFSPLLEKQDLVIFADLKVLGNWTESRFLFWNLLRLLEVTDTFKYCQGHVIKQNKILASVMIYKCPPGPLSFLTGQINLDLFTTDTRQRWETSKNNAIGSERDVMCEGAFLYLTILHSLIADLVTHSVGVLIPYYVLNHTLEAGHTNSTHHPLIGFTRNGPSTESSFNWLAWTYFSRNPKRIPKDTSRTNLRNKDQNFRIRWLKVLAISWYFWQKAMKDPFWQRTR